MKILVLNSGSSSQKSALFELAPEASTEPVAPLWEGKLEWDGDKEKLTVHNSGGKTIKEDAIIRADDRRGSLEKLLTKLWESPAQVISHRSEIEVVGHRIVHGGPHLSEPAIITPEVKQAIQDVAAIAPLHNAAGLQGIDLAEKLFPKVKQIAVFDTGFHRTLPLAAKVYPGPYEWFEHDIRRYGFHGINHEYCAARAAQLLKRELSSLKIVSCHLGNGCSLASIDGGKSVDTTMGFTPLEGLMMGTRSGSVDPGILFHLMRAESATATDLDKILNRRSGLLGISGVSSDMRDVLEAASQGNARAKLAVDIFVHRLQAGIAAMAASLGGMDVIIFTAGIGENAAEIRSATCAKLGFLGVQLDDRKNSSPKADCEVSTSKSAVRVLVIRAQEDWSIARECLSLSIPPRSTNP
ncbi:MAG: acetate/propionate family kinase [Terriglobales bacterium]